MGHQETIGAMQSEAGAAILKAQATIKDGHAVSSGHTGSVVACLYKFCRCEQWELVRQSALNQRMSEVQ